MERPPFLKRRMGYGTVGGFLGCVTLLVVALVVALLLLWVGSQIE